MSAKSCMAVIAVVATTLGFRAIDKLHIHQTEDQKLHIVGKFNREEATRVYAEFIKILGDLPPLEQAFVPSSPDTALMAFDISCRGNCGSCHLPTRVSRG